MKISSRTSARDKFSDSASTIAKKKRFEINQSYVKSNSFKKNSSVNSVLSSLRRLVT